MLRRVRDRIQARGANAASDNLTPLETSLADDANLINAALADPAFKEHNTDNAVPAEVTSAGGAWRKR